MKAIRKPVDWPLMSRIVAGVVGGYGLTSLLILLVTFALSIVGVERAEALHATTIASFLVYAGIVMAVFHAASATRAWCWLLGAGVPAGLLVWAMWPGAGA